MIYCSLSTTTVQFPFKFQILLSTCISSSESVIFDKFFIYVLAKSILSLPCPLFCFPEFSFFSLFLSAYYIHNSYMRGASFLQLHFYFYVQSLYCHLLKKQVVCYFCHSHRLIVIYPSLVHAFFSVR